MPTGLPLPFAPKIGDFLGCPQTAVPMPSPTNRWDSPRATSPGFVLALKTYLGIEKAFADLNHSDHPRSGKPAFPPSYGPIRRISAIRTTI